jgi:signal transduction histidine kinase
MRVAAANRTALGATLALGVLVSMGLLAANRFGAAAGALAILSSGLVALVIHRESVGRQRAEAALRRASDEQEHFVAQRTAELNTANVALHAEILERHRIEEELRHAHDELESRVAERTRELAAANRGLQREIDERNRAEAAMRRVQVELERANRDLVRTNQEIQNFYHTLSHELKTPLTAAREFIAIVMDGLGGSVSPTQADYLRIALDSCNQLRVCINDLLDATRLETGKLSIDLRPAALDALIQRVVVALSPAAAERGIALDCAAAADLTPVALDDARITQVVTNLLNNALKFTPRGGAVSVRVEPRSADGDFVQVTVRDTGRGIPGDQIEHIFDRLYQVKSGDAATEAGIGLGLYICRELVRLHGGEIRVESTPGQGSAFTFTLPRHALLSRNATPEAPRVAARRATAPSLSEETLACVM